MAGENPAPSGTIPIERNGEFTPDYGKIVPIAPLLHRVTANNPSPFTWHGTNSYLVGDLNGGDVGIIDPGPALAAHQELICGALAHARSCTILITHSHKDHCAGAGELAQKLSAPIWGGPPIDDQTRLSRWGDAHCAHYQPQRILSQGAMLSFGKALLEVIETPGHCANHLVFGLTGRNILLSGDHVMGWSSSVIIPPDGSMQAYRDSLKKLLDLPYDCYLPGHGGPACPSRPHVQRLIAHRQKREEEILAKMAQGETHVEQLVSSLYANLDTRLIGAAKLTVFAHLIALVDRGRISRDGPLDIEAEFRLNDIADAR